jgi:hypothetical protein
MMAMFLISCITAIVYSFVKTRTFAHIDGTSGARKAATGFPAEKDLQK